MHTVEMLDAALALARQMGYRVREEWLDGHGGGGCEIRHQKWIFLDRALSAEEQLAPGLDTLRADPATTGAPMADELRRLLGVRKIA